MLRTPSIPLISIVLPALNEAEGLSEFVTTLISQCEKIADISLTDIEIVIIDDGSVDATYACIEKLATKNSFIRGIKLSRHYGKEAALLAGLNAATGQAVVTMDSDGEHPIEKLSDFIHSWRQGVKIVHGVKDRSSQRLRLGARLFNRLFTRLTGLDLIGASDYKLLDRQVVDILINQFPEHVRFHRGLTEWVGFKQATVSFSPKARTQGQSSWSTWSLMRYALGTISGYSHLPLKLVPFLGGLMFLVSLVLGGDALYSRLNGQAVSGFATLEITILFVGSIMMIGLGIIGLYLARMYDELKQRPVSLEESRTDKP